MMSYQVIARAWASVVLVLTFLLTAEAQKAEKPSASLSEIETAIERDPANPKLRVALGLAYWDHSDYPHALEAFQLAVKVGPTSAEAHNWLGVAILEKADLPGAIAEFRKAVSLDPKYARAHTNLASALAKSGELSEAVKIFEKALALEPDNLGAHMNLGVALREKGDAQGALVHLRRVAKSEPANASVQYELGQTLRQSGDLAGAVEAFERALQIDPELREGYYGLGVALKQQSASARKQRAAESPADDLYKRGQEAAARGEWNVAKEQLIEALRVDVGHAEAHNLLGFILGQQGDLPSALVHLERSVALRPESAEARYNLGVALWYSDAKDRALAELRESVHLNPAYGASYAFLGTTLREKGQWVEARVSLQRAIALLPPMAAMYIDLGIVYLRAGDLDKALGQFETGLNVSSTTLPAPDWDTAIAGLRDTLARNPGKAEAHNVLGLLLGRKGADNNQVLAEFREAVRLRPDFAEAHNNIGLVLAQGDNDEPAVAAFREAIRIRPDYADAHANLGATLTQTDAEQAIRELEQAVALAPNSVKAQFNLAVAYAAGPNAGSAKEIEQLRKVIALDANFARAHLALGKALLRDGKVQEAVTELQEATRLDPQGGDAHYQLGLALARAGRREEAAAEVQKGRELAAADDRSQNANLDIAEGRAALGRGEMDQAAAKFRHALKLQPDSADAQHYLGVALEKQGDTQGASEAYRKALDLNPGDLSARQGIKTLTNTDEDDPEQIKEYEGYIRESRFKEVEPLLAAYVQQRPKSSWGWYALGYSQFAQQKVGDSIQSLAKSLRLNIRNSEAHKILGRDLMIVGRFDAAQTEFEQGIHYSPQSAEMHYDLGKLFSMQDNWEPARKEFEQALRLDPSYAEDLDALGLALEALGDDTGAVASYQKAIALNESRNGTFASAHVNLSAYYNRTGDPEKALEYAHKALELDPKSDRALFQEARAEERQGHLNEAVDSLVRAISFNPRASSYYYVLSGLYRRLGKKEESRKALEVFTQLDRETNELEKKRRSSGKPGGSPPRPGGERE
jgi:tetratricopeptide (TPR) repeat protein